MFFLTIILALVTLFSNFDAQDYLKNIIYHTQSICLNFAPTSTYSDYYEAIVCGEKTFSDKNLLTIFKQSGLFHLLVVSGSHLVFLSMLIDLLKTKHMFEKILKYFVLILFAFCSGFEPPIFRSLLFFLIYEFNVYKKLNWSSSDVCLVSVLCCLLLNRSWWTSSSLLMSYTASLGLLLFLNLGALYRHIGMYILMSPFLLPLGIQHFSSFLFNFFLSNIIGYILFPISLLCFAFHKLSYLADQAWSFLFFIIKNFHPDYVSTPLEPLSFTTLWFLSFTLQAWLIWHRK